MFFYLKSVRVRNLVKTYTQGVKSRKMLVIEGDDSLCSRIWCGVVDVVLMLHICYYRVLVVE